MLHEIYDINIIRCTQSFALTIQQKLGKNFLTTLCKDSNILTKGFLTFSRDIVMEHWAKMHSMTSLRDSKLVPEKFRAKTFKLDVFKFFF